MLNCRSFAPSISGQNDELIGLHMSQAGQVMSRINFWQLRGNRMFFYFYSYAINIRTDTGKIQTAINRIAEPRV